MGYASTFIIGGGLTQLANWRINKAKAKEEVKSDAIENLRKTMEDFYKPIIDDQNQRITDLLTQNKELRQEVQDLRNEIRDIYKYFGDLGVKAFREKSRGKHDPRAKKTTAAV